MAKDAAYSLNSCRTALVSLSLEAGRIEFMRGTNNGCPAGLGQTFIEPIRLTSDGPPVFLANVVVNLNGGAATIQSVAAVSLRPGNPVVFAGIHVVVVGLEACSL